MLRQTSPELEAATSVPGVYRAFLWHNVVISVWLSPVTEEVIPVLEQGCRLRAAAHPEGMSTVQIIVPSGGGLPSSEARSGFSRIAREYGHLSPVNAVVIPGSGFWASAQRGLVTAFSLLTPRGSRLRMFATMPEARAALAAARPGRP